MPLRVTIFIKGLFLIFLFLGVASCDRKTNQGAGGCGGDAGNSGLILCINSITPVYNGTNTDNVDVQQGTFANGGCKSAGQIEVFKDHTATVVLSAILVNGATQPTVGNTIVITHFTIDYLVNTGSTGPAIASLAPNETITVTTGATTSVDLSLMNTTQKEAYLAAVGSNPPAEAYTVTYTMYGKDQANRDVSARGFVEVLLANYINPCS